MKPGDIVKHDPTGNLKVILEDWGWVPDFKTGVIVEVKDEEALVYYIDDNLKTPTQDIRWFPLEQLKEIK